MSLSIVILSAPHPDANSGAPMPPDPEAWDGRLATGELLATLQGEGRPKHVQLIQGDNHPTGPLRVAGDILNHAPDVLLIEWTRSDNQPGRQTLNCLRDLGFKGPIIAFGPPCLDSRHAGRIMAENRPIDGVLWGPSREGVLGIPRALPRGGGAKEEDIPRGLSLRQGRSYAHGRDLEDEPKEEPSPWEGALSPSPGGCGALRIGCFDPRDGAFSPRGHGAIRRDLDILLGPMGVQDLLILPTPADTDPTLFRWLLLELNRRSHGSRIHVGLGQLPGDALSRGLADAGVRWITYDPTRSPVDGPEGRLGRPLLRARIKHLKELGILTQLRIPTPTPGWTLGDIEGLIDLGIKAAVGHIDLAPYCIPPGSPLAKRAKARGILRQRHAPYACLGTPEFPTSAIIECRGWSQTLRVLLPTLSGTLRALHRVVGGRSTTLLTELGESMGLLAQIEPIQDPLSGFLGAMALILKDANASDALPALEDLAELESLIADGHPPPPLPTPPAPPEDFGALIPILSPRAIILTFAHDTLALLRGTPADQIPASRSDVLALTLERGLVQAIPLPRLNRLALELVDGARSLDMLAMALSDSFPKQGYDHDALLGIYGDLLALGAIIPAGTLEDPPAPALRNNVLPFRKRTD